MTRTARPVALLALMMGLCFQGYAKPTETLPADVLGELRGPVHLLGTNELGPLEKRAWKERPPKLMPPPKIVYRGDKRSPDEIRAIGGFLPRSEVEPTNENNGFSLFNHHEAGTVEGGKRVTAYVSTTRFFGTALGYANMASKAGGWIYQIQATPHMVDSDGTLLKGRRYRNEFEFSALAGIPWAQVKSAVKIGPGKQGMGYYKPGAKTWNDITWEDVQKAFPDKQWVENEDYNSAFDRFKSSLGQPQLAGWFDVDHEEYKSQCPWNLTQLQTVKEYFIDFMNQVGEPVGWTGTYPLVLTKGRPAAQEASKATKVPVMGETADQKDPQEDPQVREDELCSTKGGKSNKYSVPEDKCRQVTRDCALKETIKDKNVTFDGVIKCVDSKLMPNL